MTILNFPRDYSPQAHEPVTDAPAHECGNLNPPEELAANYGLKTVLPGFTHLVRSRHLFSGAAMLVGRDCRNNRESAIPCQLGRILGYGG
jgi:hypothetical protein